ncbi:MAG: DUF2059 domain-containing protein [Acetobacteraceae bacterium]|nr:DUF2059 domain-containing protein [Acetobacteraceae bacterium]
MTTTHRTIANRTAAAAMLLGGLLSAGAAWGQAAPAPAQPAPTQAAPAQPAHVATEASRREARALGEKLGWEAQVRGIINTLRTAIIVNLAQTNGKTPQDMIGVVDDLLIPDFVGDAGALSNMIVEAWAGAFTAEELRNLRNFYSTPLGEKLLRTIPQLNNVINQGGQAWAQKNYKAAQEKHTEEFTKRGIKFAP